MAINPDRAIRTLRFVFASYMDNVLADPADKNVVDQRDVDELEEAGKYLGFDIWNTDDYEREHIYSPNASMRPHLMDELVSRMKKENNG